MYFLSLWQLSLHYRGCGFSNFLLVLLCQSRFRLWPLKCLLIFIFRWSQETCTHLLMFPGSMIWYSDYGWFNLENWQEFAQQSCYYWLCDFRSSLCVNEDKKSINAKNLWKWSIKTNSGMLRENWLKTSII